MWIAAALFGRVSASFWAVALALGMLTGCMAPGRGGTSAEKPAASARPEVARGTDAADDIQVYEVNGERLRIPAHSQTSLTSNGVRLETGSGNWGSMRGLGELEITAAEAALRFWLLCDWLVLTESRNP